MAHCGQGHPLAGSPWWCKKGGWTSHKEQAGKQHFFMVTALVPALSSCPDFHLGPVSPVVACPDQM